MTTAIKAPNPQEIPHIEIRTRTYGWCRVVFTPELREHFAIYNAAIFYVSPWESVDLHWFSGIKKWDLYAPRAYHRLSCADYRFAITEDMKVED